MSGGATIVVDIGKTYAKASLWDPEGTLLARFSHANAPSQMDGYLALDATGIETWLMDCLRQCARRAHVTRIVPVAHGAAAGVITNGGLWSAPMDYEEETSPAERAEYDAERDPFAETGSPALPCGLNLGMQLHRLERLRGPLPRDAVIVPWPQYWAWRLCGVAASEVSSLGCHTDLWRPMSRTFSALAMRRAWAERFAPLRSASEALGPITVEVAQQTGLPRDCLVFCGIHDSNAALLSSRGHRDIADHDATVLSTGTWFVAMRSLGSNAALDAKALPEARDCLLNVDVTGRPVPSARFMGGREAELIGGVDQFALTVDYRPDALIARLPALIANGACALPTFVRGVGPFPRSVGEWRNKPNDAGDQRAVAGLYLALVADTALDLIGSRDRLLIEGRFAEAVIFTRALATLRPRQRVYVSNAQQDVAYGVLRLLDPQIKPPCELKAVQPLDIDLNAYAAEWRARAYAAQSAA